MKRIAPTISDIPGIVCILALCVACFVNTAFASTDALMMSAKKQKKIGTEMYEKMMAEGAAYDNQALQDYVDRIGQSLVANSDRPSLEFTFTVLDNPDINAFATPGGFIYVNRGLMAYLDNEAELAGVISHEIGHITARHVSRQNTANTTSKTMSFLAYVFTGSAALADAASMAGMEMVRGYGREHELEADGLGAEYMHATGYDPYVLLEVIGVLKEQEQFQRVKAKSGGSSTGTYHGLYATHPRNDARLQRVIRTAGDLDQTTEDPSRPGEFQAQMEGLVWGNSSQSQRSDDRYYHNKLGFTLDQPEGWEVAAGSKEIVASAADSDASLTITVRRLDKTITTRNVLESSATGTLSAGTELDQAGLTGYTVIASANGISRRLAAINYRNLTYLFEGKAADFTSADKTLLSMVESFRPIHPNEKESGTTHYIHYIQVPRGATMASLAAGIRIPDAEARLRLLNGFYPRGEPRTGDWIKVIR
jgi:predicted Zn-dependent protease